MDQKTHHSFVSTSPSMDVMSYVMLEPFLLTSELLARIWQAAPANTTTEENTNDLHHAYVGGDKTAPAMGFPVNKANPKLDESTPIRIPSSDISLAKRLAAGVQIDTNPPEKNP